MIAIRTIKCPVDRKIVIDLPDDFKARQVEVIVMPFEDDISLTDRRSFGSGKDQVKIHDSFYEPLDDFRAYI